MVDIYVLECEDGNVYVGKTTKGEKRLKQHIDGRGAEWTKMHKPKQVMQYYTNATDADERKVTDQMIKKYGAKKVRGAGLTKRKMTKKEIDNLNKKVGFTKTKTQTRSRKKSTTTKKRNSKAKAAKSSTKKKSKSKWIAPGYKKDRFGRIVPKTARDYAAEKKSKSATTKKKTTARKKTSSSPKRKRTTSRSKSTSSRSRYYRRR